MPSGFPVRHPNRCPFGRFRSWAALAVLLTGLAQPISWALWNPQAVEGLLLYPSIPSEVLPDRVKTKTRHLQPEIASVQLDGARQYVLFREGIPIGTIQVHHRQKPASDTVVIESKNHFKRDGDLFETGWNTSFIEPASSQLPIQFNYRSHVGAADFITLSGEVDRKRQAFHYYPANLQAGQAQSASGQSIALEREIPFVLPESESQRLLFQSHFQDSPKQTFAFQTLELGNAPKLVTVNAAILPQATCQRLQGKSNGNKNRKLFPKEHSVCFQLENTSGAESSIIEWRNSKGQLIQAKSPGDGTELVYALTALNDMPAVDIIKTTRIASNFIPHPRLVNRAQYKLALANPGSSDMLRLFQDDDRQRKISEESTGSLVIEVKSSEPADVAQEFPVKGEMVYLVDTPLLQSANPQLVQAGKEITRKETRAYFAGQMLRRWVYRNVRAKNYDLGFSTALDVMNTRSGDCTEHAVLLAALLRSLGIPSRVAVGLIYMPADTGHSATTGMGYWVYHLWTEAQVGTKNGQPIWASLDASQSEDLMDAAHLKLGDSPLSSLADVERLSALVNRLSGHLRIDVLSAFSPQETVYDIQKTEAPAIPEMSFGKENASGEYSVTAAQAIPPKNIDLKSADTLANTKAKEKEYRVAALPQNLLRHTPEGAFQAGVDALKREHYAGAVEAFGDAVMQHRGNASALVSIGRRLFSLEMYRQAKRAFELASAGTSSVRTQERSFSLNTLMPWPTLSETQESRFQHALALSARGESQPALSEMQQLVRQQPAFAPAYAYLAKWQNDPALYRQFQQHAPGDPRPDMALGELALNQGQYPLAAQWFSSAKRKINLHPEMWQGVAGEAAAKESISEALYSLRVDRRNANAWYRLGKGYQSIASVNEAINAYYQTLRYRPGDASANAALLHLAIDNHRWDKATTYASRLRGGPPEASAALGYYQMRQRQYAAAIQTLRQAVSKSPGDADAVRYLSESHMRRYDLYRRESDWQQAFDVLQRAISTGSGENRSLLERVYIQTVLTPPMAVREGDEPTASYYVQALDYANQLIVADWSMLDMNVRVQKARLLALMSQYEESQKILDEVLDIAPYDAAALAAQGYLSEVRKSPLQAMAFYQQALKQDPEQFMARQGLHTVMSQEGITLDRPSLTWLLSADERDYLRLWMASEHEWTRRQKTLTDALLPLLDHLSDITLKAQANRNAINRLLTHQETWEKAVYQRLKSMPLPKRMEQLQYFGLARFYTDIEMVMAEKAFLPNFTALTMSQKRELMAMQFQKGMDNIDAAFSRYVRYVKTQLPLMPQELDRILASADADNMASLSHWWVGYVHGLNAVKSKIAEQMGKSAASSAPASQGPADVKPQPAPNSK